MVLTIVLSFASEPEPTRVLVDVTMESCCPTLLVRVFCREVKVVYSTTVSVETKVERDVLNAFDAAEIISVERSGWVAIGTDEAAFAAAMEPARKRMDAR
jgi:hypothetical protein